MIDIMLTAIGLTGLMIGSATDIKKREVPDWLNYSLVASGLGLRLIGSLVMFEWQYFLYGLLGFGVFLAIAYLMFYAGQWGGGDSKMLIGLGAVFATYPVFLLGYLSPKLNFPFLAIFFLNTIMAGAVYGIVYSAALAIKNKRVFLDEAGKILRQKTVMRARNSILAVSLFFITIVYFAVSFIMLPSILLVSVFMLTFYLWVFSKAVERACLLKYVSPEKLTEGDWIAKDVYIGKRLVCSPKDLGIEKGQIKELVEYKKKGKIDKILIKEGMPFVPSFLIGLIISLLWGNWLMIFF